MSVQGAGSNDRRLKNNNNNNFHRFNCSKYSQHPAASPANNITFSCPVCKSDPQPVETFQGQISMWPWASTLLVSCRSSKSSWRLASPEEHKHQKIYESAEWKRREVPQCFTWGPGKPIFPGGPSAPCGEREGWEMETWLYVSWADGEDTFSLLRIHYARRRMSFLQIKCCFTITTLVPGCTAWLRECF